MYTEDNVKNTIKKTGKQLLLLLLTLLLAVPALPASAAGGLSSQASAVASALEGMDAPSSIEGGATPPPTSSAPSQPEATPAPTQPPEDGGEGEEAPPSSGEEEPDKEPGVDALPLLVVGGHDTYLSGYEGAYFKPENHMLRGEVASMMYNLLAAKPPVTQPKFTDVPEDSWWYTAINSVAEAGAFNGKGDGTFAPSSNITRAEFVTALSNCFGVESGSVEFTDVPESHWAYPYIASAVKKGWIKGFGDGRFGPDELITRSQAVTIMNSALGRRDDDFAKDRGQQKFHDVPTSHWAYLEVAEAAKPVGGIVTPTPTPTPPPDNNYPFQSGDTVRVTADIGLNVREEPNGAIIAAVAEGALLSVISTAKWPWVQVRLSTGRTGYVHSDYVEKYTGNGGNGDGPVTGSGAKLSTGSVALHQYQSFRLDASVTSGMDAMVWTSSNPDVAEVSYTVPYNGTEQGAMVYGKNPGTTTLTFSDRAGTTTVSCTVTVSGPEAVRYAYSDGISVGAGVNFNLIAVTDPSRTAARFDIVSGPAQGSYTATEYTTSTSTSKQGLPDNTVRVFRANVAFSAAGDYTLRAYSADASGSYSTDYKEFTLRVTNVASATTVSGDTRRASAGCIQMIAGFEGFVSEIEDDFATAKNPTVGHGYVVPVNHTFYNNLTKEEAFGMLIDTVDNKGFATAVENYRKKYGMRMSQAQFDALVSFTYNLGPAHLNPDKNYTFAALMNAVVPPVDIATNGCTGYLNVGEAFIYAASDIYSERYTTVPNGATVTVTGTNRISSESKQEMWYKVSYNGTTGWMPAGYVRLNIRNPIYDLNYVDSTVFAYNFLQWHTASGTHYVGLLRRRMAELKVFFFGNYAEASSSHPNYKKNTYGFIFPTCCTS